MTTVNTSKEQGVESGASVSEKPIVVMQPQKLEGLLETIDLMNTVSERMGEDKSGDLGSSGGTGGATKGDDDAQSIRQQEIAALPSAPIMQKKIEQHVRQEIKKLRSNVKKEACKAGIPGSAYKLNELYSRIRRLNTVLSEILHSSAEVVKRLYIRIFIDKQPVF